MRATLRSVAAKAGVSICTVSHVINMTARVAPETRTRVMAAIKALRYQPNLVARSLRRRQTRTLGLVVANIDDTFFTTLVKAVQDACGQAGYQVILCNTDEDIEKEKAAVRTLFGTHVDGLILAPAQGDHQYLREYLQHKVPLLTINRRVANPPLPSVTADNENGCRMGTEHLVKCGHRRIGIIAGLPKTSTNMDRLRGYRRALAAHRIPYDPQLVCSGHLKIEGGYAAVKTLLSVPTPPTAIFALNNAMSEGALLALRDLGIPCPGQIALLGYDDFRSAAALHPPLTVVAQPTRDMGTRAVAVILQMVKRERPVPRAVVLPTEFIHRTSCGCAETSPAPNRAVSSRSSAKKGGTVATLG